MSGAGRDATLEDEARVLGRYLVGRVPPAELVDRYVAACRALFPDPGPPAEEAALAFARRHPWAAGCLDGAAGLVRPTGRYRGKVLVMAAVLEASPAFADAFLPRNVSVPRLAARLVVSGAAAVLEAAAGLVLWRVAARARS